MRSNFGKIRVSDVLIGLMAVLILSTGSFILVTPKNLDLKYGISSEVELTKPSVVHIENKGICQGSGVLIGEDLIVTAKHVVDEGTEFIITFDDGRKVTSTDCLVSRQYDVAFIKIVPIDNVPFVAVGKYKDVQVGNGVFVIGSPYGFDNFNSVTLGIISAKLRDLGPEYEYGWRVTFQTDAPIHPGNSGGPVFNMKGEVIGIVVAGQGYSGNVSYCVPVDVFNGDLNNIRLLFELNKYTVLEQKPVEEPDWSYDEFDFVGN